MLHIHAQMSTCVVQATHLLSPTRQVSTIIRHVTPSKAMITANHTQLMVARGAWSLCWSPSARDQHHANAVIFPYLKS
eukprot:1156841-Pelagomonas_calceolata.AAC.7